MASGDGQFGLTWNGIDAIPTKQASCSHPYGEQPVGITAFERNIYTIPLAGYAAQHAPDNTTGQKVGTVAMRMRTFDREHRHWMLKGA